MMFAVVTLQPAADTCGISRNGRVNASARNKKARTLNRSNNKWRSFWYRIVLLLTLRRYMSVGNSILRARSILIRCNSTGTAAASAPQKYNGFKKFISCCGTGVSPVKKPSGDIQPESWPGRPCLRSVKLLASQKVSKKRVVQRLRRVQQSEIHSVLLTLLFKKSDLVLHDLSVFLPEEIRHNVHLRPGLHVDKLRALFEIKEQFRGVQNLEHDDVIAVQREVAQTIHHPLRFIIEIRYQGHDAPFPDPL